MNKAFCRVFQSVCGIYLGKSNFEMPERIEGVDSFFTIADILKQQEKRKPMLVTGPRVGATEFFKELVKDIDGQPVVYDRVQPDPTVELVEEMVRVYRENDCDSIIAVGGGSNMDAAKAMGARIARPDKQLNQMGGLMKVGRDLPLLITVPTTAGTGSETTMSAVIVDGKTHHKYAINDGHLLPKYAVLDPSLTTSLPPALTAATGMDALTHAVEAYLNKAYHNENTVDWCEEAVAAIMEFLPIAYEDGQNMEAREELLLASFKAGEAFCTACVGNVHAIAHTIGGLYHVPHGRANAVVLPIVLADYGSSIYEPLSRLADVCEICPGGSQEEKAKAFINRINEMNEMMEIPEHISEISEKDIPRMAAWAEKEANPLYPVPVIYSKEHFAEVIRKVRG